MVNRRPADCGMEIARLFCHRAMAGGFACPKCRFAVRRFRVQVRVMNRLAIVSLFLASLTGVLDVTGWVGDWYVLARIALCVFLICFIVSAAASALRTERPR